MSQNLTLGLVALPALTIPVTPAQNKTFLSDTFQLQTLDHQQIWAISIVSKCRTLQHKGTWATNYITNKNQLIADAASFLGGVDIAAFEFIDNYLYVQMQVALDWSSAYGSDATTPTTINGLIIEAAGLVILPESTLRQIYQYLRYLVG